MRKALEQEGRADLIGGGCEALIPAQPPKEALQARRERANDEVKVDHHHAVPTPGKKAGKKKGYQPGRQAAGRRERRGQR